MIKAVGLLGLLAIGALTGALGAAWYVAPAGGSAEGGGERARGCGGG